MSDSTAMRTSGGGLAVIIPTRDRPELAMNAIRSVLNQSAGDVDVLISDNSTSPASADALAGFCKECGDPKVQYVRPEPLPMSPHWDWAVAQAMARFKADHFAVLTDRMVFRPDALRSLTEILDAYPDRLVCYMHDKVFDFAPPFTVQQNEWTGRLYEIRSARLLALSAESVMYDASVPRMLNCVAPRSLFEAILRRYGTVVSSIAPDWNFAYRALALTDSILYFQKPILVHYALNQSNGESVQRGIGNAANAQFVRDLNVPINVDAPYPEIQTVWNAIISEYVSAQRETQSAKFPPLNMQRYAHALERGIRMIENPALRVEMEERLTRRGWEPGEGLWRHLVHARHMTPGEWLWKLKAVLRPAKSPTFETREQALAFAVSHLGPQRKAITWETTLTQAVEVPLPDGVHA